MCFRGTCKITLSSTCARVQALPALDTAWQLREGHPEGQAGSDHRSSEWGRLEPASAALRSDSGPRGNQQKSFGCILCQTGTK